MANPKPLHADRNPSSRPPCSGRGVEDACRILDQTARWASHIEFKLPQQQIAHATRAVLGDEGEQTRHDYGKGQGKQHDGEADAIERQALRRDAAPVQYAENGDGDRKMRQVERIGKPSELLPPGRAHLPGCPIPVGDDKCRCQADQQI